MPSRERYAEKLEIVNGIDPYELERSEWQDDVSLFPATTQLQVCLYLILSPDEDTKKLMGWVWDRKVNFCRIMPMTRST